MSDRSLLGSSQIMKFVYDSTYNALRMSPAANTEFAIELSAADGDSVIVLGNGLAQESAVIDSNTTNGVVIAAVDCTGIKSFQVWGQVTNHGVETPGNASAILELSPSATANLWYTASTFSVSAAGATVQVDSIVTDLIAKRARVSLSNALGDGAVKFYLVGNSL